MTDDITVDGWWQRSDGKQAVALSMKDDRLHAREAWVASGFAVEFALKAVIMKRKRLNRWPDNTPENKDYYTHNLRKLMEMAEIERKDIPAHLRAKFGTLLDWERSHDYVHGVMPRKIARQMYRAAFDADGVVPWLKSL